MVASTHWLASTSGMAVLEAGGTAFDAAIAAGLVLHVVEPHLNGLGGDMPLLAYDAREGRAFTVCGQGVAPAQATGEAYRDLGLDSVPGVGHLAAVVPGSWGAWMALLAQHGTMPLRTLAASAMDYAGGGYPLVPQAADTIASMSGVFAEHWPTSASVYLGNSGLGGAPMPGSRFANRDLAATLERLVAEGEAAGSTSAAQAEGARRAFYQGFVAEAVDSFAATQLWDGAGRSQRHRGLLTGTDLASWRASVEAPVTLDAFGVTIAKTGMWGQGPILLQQLAMLERAGVADVDPDGPEFAHLVIEASKLAMADREAWYGDSFDSDDHADAILADLLDPAYTAERVALIGPAADADLRPGTPGGRAPRLPEHVRAAMAQRRVWPDGMADASPGTGEPTVPRGDTCHLDVVDRWGNTVSATPSGGWLQSSAVVPGLGFSLPTRAQMFWLEPGLPASLRPGRRPRTTLSPGLVLPEGRARLAFGTPGGDQQDQWTAPFLLRLLTHGENLQQAIDAPTWHSTHAPSSFAPRAAEPLGVRIESRVGEQVLEGLRARGHRVSAVDPWSLGRISAAGVREDGMLIAAANARGMQGYAVGR